MCSIIQFKLCLKTLEKLAKSSWLTRLSQITFPPLLIDTYHSNIAAKYILLFWISWGMFQKLDERKSTIVY